MKVLNQSKKRQENKKHRENVTKCIRLVKNEFKYINNIIK